jgi:hypothetical protein
LSKCLVFRLNRQRLATKAADKGLKTQLSGQALAPSDFFFHFVAALCLHRLPLTSELSFRPVSGLPESERNCMFRA